RQQSGDEPAGAGLRGRDCEARGAAALEKRGGASRQIGREHRGVARAVDMSDKGTAISPLCESARWRGTIRTQLSRTHARPKPAKRDSTSIQAANVSQTDCGEECSMLP